MRPFFQYQWEDLHPNVEAEPSKTMAWDMIQYTISENRVGDRQMTIGSTTSSEM